jgi:hypothetical protein
LLQSKVEQRIKPNGTVQKSFVQRSIAVIDSPTDSEQGLMERGYRGLRESR